MVGHRRAGRGEPAGARPDALDDVLTDLHEAQADSGGDFRAGMLAVIERRTGVRLDAGWFTRGHEAIVAPGWRAERGQRAVARRRRIRLSACANGARPP